MSQTLLTLLARLRRAAQPGASQLGDGELLERFVQGQDAAALELLFWRHGPMVWGVCRRVLGESPDAEDAFQATFLVLVRRASGIRRGQALAAWLHRVAWRTALNAQAARRRRVQREQPVACLAELPGREEGRVDEELRGLIDEELARLPEKFRLPVILCDLEARSNAEAAAGLGCPLGTLNSRLARGRQKLRQRLLRRGVALPALAATAVPAQVASAALPALWRAPSVAVQALAEGTIRTLVVSASWRAMAGVLACMVVLGGLALGAFSGREADEPPARSAAAEPPLRFIDPDAHPLPAEALARIGSLRLRHQADIGGLAYSPDGRWLASVSMGRADRTARVWDAATGKEKLRVTITPPRLGASRIAPALGFAADGQQFLVADAVSLRGFDLGTGKELFAQPLPGKDLVQTALAPDGKTVVLTRNDGQLELRDVATGKVRHSSTDSGLNPFGAIEFSPDSRRFALWKSHESVPVFATESGRQIGEVRVEGRKIGQIRFLPGGDQFALLLNPDDQGQEQRLIGFFDLKAGKLVRTATVDGSTEVIAVSPDGKLVFAGNTHKGYSQLIDSATGKEIGRVRSTYVGGSLVFAPDGTRVAAGVWGAIAVWDIPARRYHPIAAVPASFYQARFAPAGRSIILPWGGHVHVDWRTGEVRRRPALVGVEGGQTPVLSPDGQFFALGERDVQLLLDATTGKEVRRLRGSRAPAGRAYFAGDGRRLAVCDWDKVIRVWEVGTGRQLASFTVPELFGGDLVALSHDGRVLAVDCTQNTEGGNVLYTWDVDAKVQLARIVAPTHYFNGIALSPDGRRLAGGGGQDGAAPEPPPETAVTIWDPATGRVLHSLPGHNNDQVRPGAPCDFSPDGRLLVTGDSAGRLRLWEVASGKEVHRFDGHHTLAMAHFSPDGRLLVAASEDAPCFVWDVLGARPQGEWDEEKLWTALAGPDAKEAFAAVRRLVADPEQAVALLRRHLKPAAGLDPARVEQLVRDIDADTFAAREKAMAELATLGDRVEPRLRAARTTASLEARRRLDRLLETMATVTPERLRESRALMALEWIATPAAVECLAELIRADRDDPLTRAAAATRERLRKKEAR